MTTIKFNGGEAPVETKGGQFPKLELQNGEVARINILTTSDWEATIRHFVQNVGYVHCHAISKAKTVQDLLKIEDEGGDPDLCPLCRMMAGGNSRIKLPQRRFAMRVLRYKTDLNGKPSPGGLKYWLEIWILDNRKYWRLQEVVKEWGDDKGRLAGHDLTLTCEDEKYQNLSIGVKRDALWTSAAKEVKAFYKEEAPKYKLADCLGQTMSEEALERRFSTLERREQMRGGAELPPREEAEEEIGRAQADVSTDIFEEEEGFKGKEDSEVPNVDDNEEDELSFLDDIED